MEKWTGHQLYFIQLLVTIACHQWLLNSIVLHPCVQNRIVFMWLVVSVIFLNVFLKWWVKHQPAICYWYVFSIDWSKENMWKTMIHCIISKPFLACPKHSVQPILGETREKLWCWLILHMGIWDMGRVSIAADHVLFTGPIQWFLPRFPEADLLSSRLWLVPPSLARGRVWGTSSRAGL